MGQDIIVVDNKFDGRGDVVEDEDNSFQPLEAIVSLSSDEDDDDYDEGHVDACATQVTVENEERTLLPDAFDLLKEYDDGDDDDDDDDDDGYGIGRKYFVGTMIAEEKAAYQDDLKSELTQVSTEWETSVGEESTEDDDKSSMTTATLAPTASIQETAMTNLRFETTSMMLRPLLPPPPPPQQTEMAASDSSCVGHDDGDITMGGSCPEKVACKSGLKSEVNQTLTYSETSAEEETKTNITGPRLETTNSKLQSPPSYPSLSPAIVLHDNGEEFRGNVDASIPEKAACQDDLKSEAAHTPTAAGIFAEEETIMNDENATMTTPRKVRPLPSSLPSQPQQEKQLAVFSPDSGWEVEGNLGALSLEEVSFRDIFDSEFAQISISREASSEEEMSGNNEASTLGSCERTETTILPNERLVKTPTSQTLPPLFMPRWNKPPAVVSPDNGQNIEEDEPTEAAESQDGLDLDPALNFTDSDTSAEEETIGSDEESTASLELVESTEETIVTSARRKTTQTLRPLPPPPPTSLPSTPTSRRIGRRDGAASDAAARLAERHWDEAISILRSAPTLMSGHILRLALHNRPPPRVIKLMLDLNPAAAAVPRSGPSALQVAVRHGASLEVVEQVIRACPYALFTGNGSYDPLTYAKIWRREEKDLIELLSHPISNWTRAKNRSGSSSRRCSTKTDSNIDSPPPGEEQRELSNIKLITAAVVKSQRKHIADYHRDREKMADGLRALEMRERRAREEFLDSCKNRERRNMKAHLVALNMKERAFESKISRLGRQLEDLLRRSFEEHERNAERREARDGEARESMEIKLSGVRDDILCAANRVERVCSSYGTRLADLAARVDRESAWNAAFREDVRMMQIALEEKIEKLASAQGLIIHSSFSNEKEDSKSAAELQPLFGRSADSCEDEVAFSDDWNVRSCPSEEMAVKRSTWSTMKLKIARTKDKRERKRFFRIL